MHRFAKCFVCGWHLQSSNVMHKNCTRFKANLPTTTWHLNKWHSSLKIHAQLLIMVFNFDHIYSAICRNSCLNLRTSNFNLNPIFKLHVANALTMGQLWTYMVVTAGCALKSEGEEGGVSSTVESSKDTAEDIFFAIDLRKSIRWVCFICDAFGPGEGIIHPHWWLCDIIITKYDITLENEMQILHVQVACIEPTIDWVNRMHKVKFVALKSIWKVLWNDFEIYWKMCETSTSHAILSVLMKIIETFYF